LTLLRLGGLLATGLGAAAVAACGAAQDEPAPRGSQLTLEQARSFEEFPLVYAGERVDGLPLVAIVRRNDTAEYVSFVYGDCRPSSVDGGCAPPAEIQVWPGSRRNLGSYDAAGPATPVPERATIRGSPAALLDAGTRLELYTGRATVVVFADSKERVRAIADALRCVSETAPAAPGSRLDC
jgi:hypothetical protein